MVPSSEDDPKLMKLVYNGLGHEYSYLKRPTLWHFQYGEQPRNPKKLGRKSSASSCPGFLYLGQRDIDSRDAGKMGSTNLPWDGQAVQQSVAVVFGSSSDGWVEYGLWLVLERSGGGCKKRDNDCRIADDSTIADNDCLCDSYIASLRQRTIHSTAFKREHRHVLVTIGIHCVSYEIVQLIESSIGYDKKHAQPNGVSLPLPLLPFLPLQPY